MTSLLSSFVATRPVLGGALLVLSGVEIVWADGRSVSLALGGTAGTTALVLGGILILFGVLAWVTPLYAPMIGLLAQGVAVLAFVAANLGGFVVGSLLGVVGGALVFAWRTQPESEVIP